MKFKVKFKYIYISAPQYLGVNTSENMTQAYENCPYKAHGCGDTLFVI